MTTPYHLHFPCPSCGEQLTHQAHSIVIPAQAGIQASLVGQNPCGFDAAPTGAGDPPSQSPQH
jgi:hypothetical protein